LNFVTNIQAKVLELNMAILCSPDNTEYKKEEHKKYSKNKTQNKMAYIN
jgi:hypothetical protein